MNFGSKIEIGEKAGLWEETLWEDLSLFFSSAMGLLCISLAIHRSKYMLLSVS